MAEKLTDEERSALDSGMCHGGMKALRIIDADAHAADRAALVARLEAAELRAVGLAQSFEAAVDKLTALQAQVAKLTRERDEALAAAREDTSSARVGIQKQAERAEAAEARVRELESAYARR